MISDFGAAGDYLAGVINCTIEGAGVGAQRTLTYADGSTIVERLEMLKPATYQMSYTLQSDTPFGNCLTTMRLRDLGPNQAELTWSASFQPVGIPPSEAVDLMEGVLVANCLALKRHLES